MKTAFILSGEGAKGSYQVGIIRMLQNLGIKPDAIYGASSGAINSIGYAYLGLDGLEDVWRSIHKRSDVFKFNGLSLLWRSGIFSPEPIEARIKQVVKDNHPICECVVNRVNLETGRVGYSSNRLPDGTTDLSYGDKISGIVSIPAVCNPSDGWIDGAVCEDAPLQRAIDDGADRIVVILGTPPVPTVRTNNLGLFKIGGFQILGIATMAYRMVELLLNQVLFNDLKACIRNNGDTEKKKIEVRVFGPTGFLFDPLDFTQSQAALDRGLKEAVEFEYADGDWMPQSRDYTRWKSGQAQI